MSSKWSFLTRTMPNLGHCLSPPNDIERNLLVLPARLGGIALAVSTDTEFLSSTKITAPLTEAILQQDPHYSAEIIDPRGAHSEKRTFQTVT